MINKLLLVCTLIIVINSYLQYCPPSYFFDAQHCQRCQDNCICRSENGCDSCVNGYTFYKGKCIQCPQTNGIYGACSECCSRQTGTVLACTDCTVVPGKYSFLFRGRCILSDGCFEVDDNGFCTQCRNKYYEVNNLCYPCDPSCATCTDPTNCITCADGYYWKVNHGGLCTACPSGCATCQQSGVCKSCLQSFYQFTDHCLSCPTDCLTCIDGSTCTSCSAGILVSNLCIRCNDLTYGGSTGCLSCIQNNNFIKCEQCADTYFLDSSTGVCRLCSSFIPGAVRCRDQNTPTQCANDADATLTNRYYLVGISCIQNLKSCKKIADVQGNCAICYPGYRLTATFQCQQCPLNNCKPQNMTVVNNVCTCTQCDPGYYLPSGSVTCQPCSTSGCAVCPNNVCSKCFNTGFLSGGSCSPGSLANCLYLATGSTCQTCMDGFYLGTDNLCYSCQTNCLKCTSRFVCTKCDTGYYLNSNACMRIPNNCYQFDTTQNKCTVCNHGYYLFEGFCQQCRVQTGTVFFLLFQLNQCQGLCPIDYYLQGLLTIRSAFQPFPTMCLLFFVVFGLMLH